MNGNPITVHEVNNSFQEKLPDYHVFCIPSWQSMDGSREVIEFKVFYEKDFTEIQYEELKELILSSIQLTNPNEQTQ